MPDWYWLMKDSELLDVKPWKLLPHGRKLRTCQLWALWKRQLQQAEYQAKHPNVVSG